MNNRKEAELEVRRNALFLRQFTVSAMIHATGLPLEVVLPVIKELEEQGFIVSDGQQEATYRLSDDPETRLTLSRSIDDFYFPPPVRFFPYSRNYWIAVQLLDQAEKNESEKEDLLYEAKRYLEKARQDGRASRTPDIVLAHISYQLGRLSFLQHDYASARRHFQEALTRFKKSGLEHESRLVEQYLNALTDTDSRFCK